MKRASRLVLVLPLLGLVVTASSVASDAPSAKAKAAAAKPAFPPTIQYPSHISAGRSAPPAGTLVNPFKGDKDMATAGVGLFGTFTAYVASWFVAEKQ